MSEGREVTYLVLINSKSGGQDGPQLLQKFREKASQPSPHRLRGEVVSLTDPGPDGTGVVGPRPGLEKYRETRNLRVIACGGDGTVGWVLSEIDNVNWGEQGKPSVAIIPLGTGNDLSRSLNWGGKFKMKPIQKYLHNVEMAKTEKLDRWKLNFTSKKHGTKHPKAKDEVPEQLKVFNNYFSLGIDALIALTFHNARNANSDKFTSRTRNLLFYGQEGGKDLFERKCRDLMEHVKVRCTLENGSRVDMTEKLKKYGAHCVLILNILSYSGGNQPWKRKSGVQSSCDNLVEVIGMDNVDLALLNVGGTGKSICQARKVEIETDAAVSIQVDGEPIQVNPFKVEIECLNSAVMLAKTKTSYPYKDEEVEDWAAREIQTSFRASREGKLKTSQRAHTMP